MKIYTTSNHRKRGSSFFILRVARVKNIDYIDHVIIRSISEIDLFDYIKTTVIAKRGTVS